MVTIHINQYDLVNVIHIHDLGWFVGLIYSAFRQRLKWLLQFYNFFISYQTDKSGTFFCIADIRCTIFYIQIFSLFWRKALYLSQLNDNSSRTDLVCATAPLSTRTHQYTCSRILQLLAPCREANGRWGSYWQAAWLTDVQRSPAVKAQLAAILCGAIYILPCGEMCSLRKTQHFFTALLVLQIDYYHWPVLASQGGVTDSGRNSGHYPKTG